MKKSKQVTNFWIQKHPNGIYHLLFNTVDKWVYFHRFNEYTYQIGGSADIDEEESFTQEIPEGLIPDSGSLVCMTLQAKDQISFYYIPREMISRNGEKIIYNSLDHK